MVYLFTRQRASSQRPPYGQGLLAPEIKVFVGILSRRLGSCWIGLYADILYVYVVYSL